MKECVFCKIARGEIPANKVYENNNFFSIPDANPKTKGHSLIISKKHFETILDVSDEFGKDLLDCIKETAKKIMKEEKASGFNILNNNFESAGQIVKHIHFHLIPRKTGDGLRMLA